MRSVLIANHQLICDVLSWRTKEISSEIIQISCLLADDVPIPLSPDSLGISIEGSSMIEYRSPYWVEHHPGLNIAGTKRLVWNCHARDIHLMGAVRCIRYM